MYLSSVLVFSIGKPFRKAFYTNIWFLLSVVILYLFSLYLIIWPDSFMKDNFKVSIGKIVNGFENVLEVNTAWNFSSLFDHCFSIRKMRGRGCDSMAPQEKVN